MTPEMMLAQTLGQLPNSASEKLAQSMDGLSVDQLEAIFRSEMKKEAFSVTPEGHAFDADHAAIVAEAGAKLHELAQRHGGMGSATRKGQFLRAIRFAPLLIDARHEEYIEKKHLKGENAYNPLGGALTPSKYERGGTAGHYGEHETGHKFRSKDSRSEKRSSALQEKLAMADQWGRELAHNTFEKQAGLPPIMGSAATTLGRGIGRAIGATSAATAGTRAAVGAGVGAVGGAVKHMAGPVDPNTGKRQGSLLGSMAGGATLGAGAGLAAKPLADAAGRGAMRLHGKLQGMPAAAAPAAPGISMSPEAVSARHAYRANPQPSSIPGAEGVGAVKKVRRPTSGPGSLQNGQVVG